MKLIDGLRVDRFSGLNDIPVSIRPNGFADVVDFHIAYYYGGRWIEVDVPVAGSLDAVPFEEIDDVVSSEVQNLLASREASGQEKSMESGAPKESGPSEKNFRYSGDSPQPTGRVSRLNANLAAIKLAKRLVEEDRLASPEEKEVLAKYNGFGADKEVFSDINASFREQAARGAYVPDFYKPWEDEYGKWYDAFKEVLTDEEWKGASASILNAHYTSGEISQSLWEIAVHLGFEGGTVLEPGCGVGNLMGAAMQLMLGSSFG